MGVDVVCMGDSAARPYCPCEFIEVPNEPLGRKWGIGYKARGYDAFLYVGSSDWVDRGWVKNMVKWLSVYDIVGVRDYYLADVGMEIRYGYWGGYSGERYGESIGIGRMLRAEYVYSVKEVFNPLWNNSMDYTMIERCKAVFGRVGLVESEGINLSISTSKWDNKHKFVGGCLAGCVGKRAVEDIKKEFPELSKLQEDLYGGEI